MKIPLITGPVLALALFSSACQYLPIEPTPTPTTSGPSGVELRFDCDTLLQDIQASCLVGILSPRIDAVIVNNSDAPIRVWGFDLSVVTNNGEIVTNTAPAIANWTCIAGPSVAWDETSIQRSVSCNTYGDSAVLAPHESVAVFSIVLTLPQIVEPVRFEGVDLIDDEWVVEWTCAPTHTAPVACFPASLLPALVTPTPTLPLPTVTPPALETPIPSVVPTIAVPTIGL